VALERRDDGGRNDGEPDAEAGCGGSGEVAVAKSSVARLSVLPEGAPQEAQKRPAAGTSEPQDEQ
jgi:hypothetical protein